MVLSGGMCQAPGDGHSVLSSVLLSLLHALLLVQAFHVVLRMLVRHLVVLLLEHVVVVRACILVARSCMALVIQVALVVSCLCGGPPVTAWT